MWKKFVPLVVAALAFTLGTGVARAQSLTDDQRESIDSWLEEQGLNEYGDPEGTMYTGGTPLFDERTGRTIDRHQYILRNNPQIRRDIGGLRGFAPDRGESSTRGEPVKTGSSCGCGH